MIMSHSMNRKIKFFAKNETRPAAYVDSPWKVSCRSWLGVGKKLLNNYFRNDMVNLSGATARGSIKIELI